MCDERERLIGYVYGECDDAERAEIDRHVAGCETCRAEIAGLNATRQDLLAWEVPDHVSVWKPFAPARLTPWWREVPAWAYAAAAGVMFLIGVSGGVAAQALVARPVQTVAAVTPAAAPAAVPVADAVSRAELLALQSQLKQSLDVVDQRIAHVSASGVLDRSASHNAEDLRLYAAVNGEVARLREKINSLQRQYDSLQQIVLQLPSGQPGR